MLAGSRFVAVGGRLATAGMGYLYRIQKLQHNEFS